MKVLCMVCPLGTPEIPEENYKKHMEIHGGSQAAGRMINQNVPPLPTGVTPSDLPSPEFLQTVAEMDAAKLTPKPPVTQPTVKITPPANPIQLTYRYTGNCPTGHAVATLEMDVEGKHFVVAYCLAESRQIESREVAKLERAKDKLEISMKNDPTVKLIRKKKTPSVVDKPSPLPLAKVNDSPQRVKTEGVKEVPIIAQK